MKSTGNHISADLQTIVAWSEGALSAADRQKFQEHLQSCPDCAALVQSAERLDAALESHFSEVKLSPVFEQGVYARLEREEALREAAAEQRARLSDEFDEYCVRLRRGLFRPTRLLDILSYALGAGVLVWLLMHFSARTGDRLETYWSGLGAFHGLLVPVATAALIALCLFGLKGVVNSVSEET
jgi:anti-sigma factor RsiW